MSTDNEQTQASASDRLAELGAADSAAFEDALLDYLVVPSAAQDAAAFRHEALRRRTIKALAKLLRLADKNDRKHQPEAIRTQWKFVREAAIKERGMIVALSRQPPEAPSPRRRALERLRHEFPDEFAALLQRDGHRNVYRKVLDELVQAHHSRFADLMREERERAS